MSTKIGRDTIFGIFANGVQISTRLVTVPFVIAHLGVDGYGIWAVIMTVAAYMRFGSAGAKSAFQKYVAEATGSGDFRQANVLLSTGTMAILVVSVAVLIPVAYGAEWLAVAMGVPNHLLPSVATAIALLAIIMGFANAGAVYEAVIMGGHRIDLARKLNATFTVLEAIAILLVLHQGLGLVAMTAIMAASEIGYVSCCYIMSHRIMPAIEVSFKHVSREVWRELVGYAGSYQLVGLLEVTYAAILPVAILKLFGATIAGEFALVQRLVGAALLIPEAAFPPILSNGSMVYATGSVQDMQQVLIKSFKITFALAILPLTFIAGFGPLIIFVWTGFSDPGLSHILWLLCAYGLFRAMSLLQLVMYRASGRSLMDNVRQVLRIVVTVPVCAVGGHIGLVGVIGGLAIAEFAGLVFMFHAISRVYEGFTPRKVYPDIVRLSAAAFIIMTASMMMVSMPLPWVDSDRLISSLKLTVVVLTAVVATWPALRLTGAVSIVELRTIMRRQ